jgi:hypothetical protein
MSIAINTTSTAGYRLIIVTGSGNGTYDMPTDTTVDYLLVGGGGAGGAGGSSTDGLSTSHYGGGGGGGYVRSGSTIMSGILSFHIGSGGIATTGEGNNGEDTYITWNSSKSLAAIGGERGDLAGLWGHGGRSGNLYTGGSHNDLAAGGGAGHLGDGSNAASTDIGGAGGIGIASTIIGITAYYGMGGGGGGPVTGGVAGSGSTGGRGFGGVYPSLQSAGSDGFGGGGGGGGWVPSTGGSTGGGSTDTYYLNSYPIYADGRNEGVELTDALTTAYDMGYRKISFPTTGVIGLSTEVETPTDLELFGNDCTIKLIDDAIIDHEQGFFYIHDNCYAHDLIFDGNMTNNGDATNGVALYNGVTFSSNEVKNVGAYSVFIVDNNVVFDHNTVHDSWQYGISAGYDVDNIEITNNTFYDCEEISIKLKAFTNTLVQLNNITVTTGSYPVGIGFSDDNGNDSIIVDQNTIDASGSGASAIWSGNNTHTNISITDNIITHADLYGILINFDDGVITGNTITYSGTCIEDNGSGNDVSGNTCTPE